MPPNSALTLVVFHNNASTAMKLLEIASCVCLSSQDTVVLCREAAHLLSDNDGAQSRVIFLGASVVAEERLLDSLPDDDGTVVVICLSVGETLENAHLRSMYRRRGAQILFEPFDEDAVRETLEQARNTLTATILQREIDEHIARLANRFFAVTPPPPNIFFPTARGMEAFQPERIAYCQANLENTTFFLLDDNEELREIVVFARFAAVRAALEAHGFARIHHSYLVNLRHCKGFEHNGKDGTLQLCAGKAATATLPVSRTFKKSLLERLNIK